MKRSLDICPKRRMGEPKCAGSSAPIRARHPNGAHSTKIKSPMCSQAAGTIGSAGFQRHRSIGRGVFKSAPGQHPETGEGNAARPGESQRARHSHRALSFREHGRSRLSVGYSATRYFPVVGIHNHFRELTTAVGDGATWVMLKPSAPFKLAYLCFDARNRDAETLTAFRAGEVGMKSETLPKPFSILWKTPLCSPATQTETRD